MIGKNGELTQHAADLQSQVQQLKQDRDTQTKLANERQAQLAKVTKMSERSGKFCRPPDAVKIEPGRTKPRPKLKK